VKVTHLLSKPVCEHVKALGIIFDSNSVVMQVLNPLRIHLENLLLVESRLDARNGRRRSRANASKCTA
jgi:hypothetical protein